MLEAARQGRRERGAPQLLPRRPRGSPRGPEDRPRDLQGTRPVRGGTARPLGAQDPHRQGEGRRRRSTSRSGHKIIITIDETLEGTAERISTSYDPLAQGREAGRHDPARRRQPRVAGGRRVRRARWSARWSCGGALKSNKGMNLPGVSALGPGAHREGPPRPRLRRRERRRLRRALLRAQARGREEVQGS